MRNCNNCSKRLWRKTNKSVIVNGHKVRVWVCRCGNEQAEEPPQTEIVKPNIVYFDIEYSPGESYYYSRKVPGGYIPTQFLKREPFVICWAACIVNDAKEKQTIISECVTGKEARAWNDSRIMKALWGILDSADYIVGHNVDGFDLKKVGGRFIMLGMDLPYEARTIDTLKLSRKYFPFESNGLDYIAVRLGGRPKLHIEFSDWRRVIETGDEKTLSKVERYCRGDVREGVGIFQHMRRVIESSGRRLVK